MPRNQQNGLECSPSDDSYLASDGQNASLLHDVTGYINAGGRGTRLGDVFTADPKIGISKALLEIGRPPIPLIDHHINKFNAARVPGIVAGVGDHTNVAQHVTDKYGHQPHVYVIENERQFGTGGDLIQAVRNHRELFIGQVLVANVDTILDIKETELIDQHHTTGAALTIALTLNEGVPNEGAYYVGGDSSVIHCAEVTDTPLPGESIGATSYRGSSTGMMVVESELLHDMNWSPDEGPLSLYKDVVGFALGQSAMFAYNNGHRLFIDVGTTDSWNYVSQHPDAIQPSIYYQ